MLVHQRVSLEVVPFCKTQANSMVFSLCKLVPVAWPLRSQPGIPQSGFVQKLKPNSTRSWAKSHPPNMKHPPLTKPWWMEGICTFHWNHAIGVFLFLGDQSSSSMNRIYIFLKLYNVVPPPQWRECWFRFTPWILCSLFKRRINHSSWTALNRYRRKWGVGNKKSICCGCGFAPKVHGDKANFRCFDEGGWWWLMMVDNGWWCSWAW